MSTKFARSDRAGMGGRRTRWVGAAAMGTLGIAVLMVLMVPASAASAPSVLHTIQITAPYTGAYASPSTSSSASGCAGTSVVTAPFWHARTGAGGFSGTARASDCAPILSGSASTDVGFLSYVPISVVSGHHTIVVKWSIRASGAESLHLGSCKIASLTNYSECYEDATIEITGSAYLVDQTNGSYVAYPTTPWAGIAASGFYYDYCYAGNCSTYSYGNASGSFSVHTSVVWTFNAHGLVASHQYVLVQSFYGYVDAYSAVYGSATLHNGHATAWLNAGTFGNGLQLTSITVH